MASAPRDTNGSNGSATQIHDYGPQLWGMANALRGNIDAAEYKHIVLPLIFLKYISDAFEELHEELESKADEGYDPEQPDGNLTESSQLKLQRESLLPRLISGEVSAVSLG